ncbi:hypothetical protein [Methylomonas sp. DH-1]|uniref:hypothetical protein n=1 Tax=Methylomonas sp. (strain DH-1) TaxID=1727196 RepID=UPI000A48A04D|nr:hypothetical protein [Methylomonas sp. DH-1]
MVFHQPANGTIPAGGCVLLSTQALTDVCSAAANSSNCNPSAAVNSICNFGMTGSTLMSIYVYPPNSPYYGKENRSYKLFKGAAQYPGFSVLAPAGTLGTETDATAEDWANEIDDRISDTSQLFNAVKADDSWDNFAAYVQPMSFETVHAEAVVTEPEVVGTVDYTAPDGSSMTDEISQAYAYYPTLLGIDATTGEVVSTPIAQDPVTGEIFEVDPEAIELENIVPGSEEISYEAYTQETKKTTNNDTGEVTETTTQTNHGQTVVENNTTNTQQIEWGTFTGASPDDGYADGLAFINDKLCNGDCDASPTCSTGTCSVSERIDDLQETYGVNPTASGDCPAISFDFGQFMELGLVESTYHCDLLESMRTSLAAIMSLVIAITCISIILSA